MKRIYVIYAVCALVAALAGALTGLYCIAHGINLGGFLP